MDPERRRGRARKQAGPSRVPSHSLGPVLEADQQEQLSELDLLGFLSQFQVAASDLASGRQHSASCGQSASLAAWGPAAAAPSEEGSEELTSSVPSPKPTSATHAEAPPHVVGAPVASAAPTLRPVLPLFQEISDVVEPGSGEEVQEQPPPSPPLQPQKAGEQGQPGAARPEVLPGPPQPEPPAPAVGDDMPSPAELRAASDAVGRILRDLASDGDTPRWAALATQAPTSSTFGSPTLPSLPLATQAPSPRGSPLLLMLTAAAGAGGRRQSGSGGALPVPAARPGVLAADSSPRAGPAPVQRGAQGAVQAAVGGSGGPPAAPAAAPAQGPTAEGLAGAPAPLAQDEAAVSDIAAASGAEESEAAGHEQGLQLVAEADEGAARKPQPSSVLAPESAVDELAVQQAPRSTVPTRGGMSSSRGLPQDRPTSSAGAVRAAAGDAAATNAGLAPMELDAQPPSAAPDAGVAPSTLREQGGSAAGSQEEEFADAVEDLPPGLPGEGDGAAAEEDGKHRPMPTYMPLTQQLFSPGAMAPSPLRQSSGSPRASLPASPAGAASPAAQPPLPSPSLGCQQRLQAGEHLPCSPLGRPAAQQEAGRATTPSAGPPSGHGESSQLRQRSAVGSESHQGSVGNGSQDDSAATGGSSQKRGRGWLSPLNIVRNAFRQRPSKAGSEGKGPLNPPLLTQQRSPQPSPQPSGSGPAREQPSQGGSPAVAGPAGDALVRQQESSGARAPRGRPQLEVCPSATAWNAVPPAAAPMDVDGSPEVRASQLAMAAVPFSQAPGGTSSLAAGPDVPGPGKELLHQGAEQAAVAAAQHADTGTQAAHATLAADDASTPVPAAAAGMEGLALEAVAPPGSASTGEGAAAEQAEPQQHPAAIQRQLSGFLSLLEHLPPSQAGTPRGSPAPSQPPSPRLRSSHSPTSQPQSGAPTLQGTPSGEAAGVAPVLAELRLSAPSLAAAMAPSMSLDEQQLQEPQALHAAAGAQTTNAAPMPAFAKQLDMEKADQAGCAAGEAQQLGANEQGMVGAAGAAAGGTSADSGGGCELLVPPTQVVLLPASLPDCTTMADAQALHSSGGSPSLMPGAAVGAAATGSDSGAAKGEPSQEEQSQGAEPLPSVDGGGPAAAAPAPLGEEEAGEQAVPESAPLPGSEEGPTLGSEEAMTPPFLSWQESQLEQVPPTPATLPTSQPPGPEHASLCSAAEAAAAGEPAAAVGAATQRAKRRALASGLVDSAFKSAIASAGKAEEAAQQAERRQLAAALTDSAFKAVLVAVAADAAVQQVPSPAAAVQAVSAAASESITLARTPPAASAPQDRQPGTARSGPEVAAAEPAQQPAPAFSFPVLGGCSISGAVSSPATGSPVQLPPALQRACPSGGGPLPLAAAQPSAAATDEAPLAEQASPPAAVAEGRVRSKRRFLEEISNNHSEDLDTLLRQQPKKLHKPALSLERAAAAKPTVSDSGSEAEGDAAEAEAEAGSRPQLSEELPVAQQHGLGAALAVASSLQQALLVAASVQAAPLPAPMGPPAAKPRPAARSTDTQTRRPPLTVASAAQTAPAPAMKTSAAQTQQPRRPPLRLAVQVQTEAWQPAYRSVGVQTIPLRRTGVSCEVQTETLQADKEAATDPRIGMADAQVQARPQLTFRATSPEPGACGKRPAAAPAAAVPATVELRAAAAASGRPAAPCPATKPAAPGPGKPVVAPKPASAREAGKGQLPQQQAARKQAHAPPAVEKKQPASEQVPVVQRPEGKAQAAKQQPAKQEAPPAKNAPPQQPPPTSKALLQPAPPGSKPSPQPHQFQQEQERGKKRPAPAGASANVQLKRCKVQPSSSGRPDEVKPRTASPAKPTGACRKRPPPGAAPAAGFATSPLPAPSSAHRTASVPPLSSAGVLPDGRRASSLPPSLRQPSFQGSGTPGLPLPGVAKAGWLKEAVAGGDEPPAPKQARHGAGSTMGTGQQRCAAGAEKQPEELPASVQPRGAVHSHAKPRAPAALPTASGRQGPSCVATPRAALGMGAGLGAATAQEPPMSPMEILRQRIARDSAKYQAACGQQAPGHAGPAAAGGPQRSRLSGHASPLGPAGMQLPGWQGQAAGEAHSARRDSSALPVGPAGGPPLRHGSSSVKLGFASPYCSPYGYSSPAPWQPPQSLQLFNGQPLQAGRAGACYQPAVGPSPYQCASGGLASWQQQPQHLLQQQPTSLLDLVMGMAVKPGM